MEYHVIFGAGVIGRAVARALVARDKRVTLVSRSGRVADAPEAITVAAGDATNPQDTVRLCEGATHVYNCTNAPDYHRWPEQFPPLQEGVLAGAAASGAKLIVLENLYMYGPHDGKPMTEEMPMRATGPRGRTRKLMSEALFAAHRAGKVRVAVARASDFYGPEVMQSLTGFEVFSKAITGKRVTLTANPKLLHSLSYAPDVAETLVRLGEDERALGRAWHVPNAPAVTLGEFVAMIFEEAGHTPAITALPRALTRVLLPLVGVMVPPARGLSENIYQTYEPFVVDDSAYRNAFGDHATTLREGIKATVTWYRAIRPEPAAHTVQGSA